MNKQDLFDLAQMDIGKGAMSQENDHFPPTSTQTVAKKTIVKQQMFSAKYCAKRCKLIILACPWEAWLPFIHTNQPFSRLPFLDQLDSLVNC